MESDEGEWDAFNETVPSLPVDPPPPSSTPPPSPPPPLEPSAQVTQKAPPSSRSSNGESAEAAKAGDGGLGAGEADDYHAAFAIDDNADAQTRGPSDDADDFGVFSEGAVGQGEYASASTPIGAEVVAAFSALIPPPSTLNARSSTLELHT